MGASHRKKGNITRTPEQGSDSTRDKPWDTAQLLTLPQTCRLLRMPAPQHGHEYQLEGHLCCRRRSWWTWFLSADGCRDHWKSRLSLQHGFGQAGACQQSPPQPSSQGNTQGDALGTSAPAGGPAVPERGLGLRRSFPSQPVRAETPHGSPAGEQPGSRRQQGRPWKSCAAAGKLKQERAGMHPHTQRDPELLPTPWPTRQRCEGRRAGRNDPHPAPPAPSAAAASDPAGCTTPGAGSACPAMGPVPTPCVNARPLSWCSAPRTGA